MLLNSLTGSIMMQDRIITPAKAKVAKEQNVTFNYWSEKMGCRVMTDAMLSVLQSKLAGALLKAGVPSEDIKSITTFQKRIDMPVDEKCIPMFKFIDKVNADQPSSTRSNLC